MATYRVDSGKVRHGDETYGPGETFEADLSDRQVEVMEITPVDGDGGETDDESDDEDDEGGDEAPEELTAEFVENADYDELRSAASHYDDVNGNWGADRLRAELLDRVESEG